MWTGREMLMRLVARDEAKREELLERGELFDGYHPEMEAVHRENAAGLTEILDRNGWPTKSDVGEKAARAAWTVAMHAIGMPDFQRRCLRLLTAAVEAGEADPADRARLLDRIRFNERRPQVYGTILDWDRAGELSPGELDEPDEVENRRSEVGLPPLAETLAEARKRAADEGDRPPRDYDSRQREIEKWARESGWLD